MFDLLPPGVKMEGEDDLSFTSADWCLLLRVMFVPIIIAFAVEAGDRRDCEAVRFCSTSPG